jgi:hypothetical protein
MGLFGGKKLNHESSSNLKRGVTTGGVRKNKLGSGYEKRNSTSGNRRKSLTAQTEEDKNEDDIIVIEKASQNSFDAIGYDLHQARNPNYEEDGESNL